MSPFNNISESVFIYYLLGAFEATSSSSNEIVPVVYLSSSVVLKDGIGSMSDPFRVALN